MGKNWNLRNNQCMDPKMVAGIVRQFSIYGEFIAASSLGGGHINELYTA
jgi:hypothetical protein